MSGIINNTTDNILRAYQEVLQSYEQLESLFHQPNYLINTLKLPLIDICIEKINYLINTEAINITENNFDTELYYSLLLLQQNLIYLKQQMCIVRTPVIVATDTNTQPKTSNNNNNNDNERQLKEIINGTQISPRVKGLQDIGGLADVKNVLTAMVVLPIYQPQLYVGRNICNTILLYGPPGTGKTQLAHALAAEASATLFSVTASDILSQYVGQTEKLVNTLFETVKEERGCSTILFMDEIDGLCQTRGKSESEWNRRLKTELLCQLSAFEQHPRVFLICATNCPWDLDPAFLRRFQRRIYVPLPTRPDRFELLELLTKNTPLEILSNHWGKLLDKTEGYSGSDLADLVRHALNIPITELINNKRWEQVGGSNNNNMLQPAADNVSFDKIIYCEIRDLPPGSVQARPVQITDLMAAVDVVKRTVAEATIQKYEKYLSET